MIRGNASSLTVAMIVLNDFENDARVLKEAQTLISEGYRVDIYCMQSRQTRVPHATTLDGINVYRVSSGPLMDNEWRPSNKFGSTLLTIRKIISRVWVLLRIFYSVIRASPDVVHAHDVNVLPVAWFAASRIKVPLIYDAHEISTGREGYSAFRGIVGWLESRIIPKAAATITTTDSRAKFFARAYGVSRPLVLQNRPRLVSGDRTNRIRNELQLSEPYPIILYQGGLQPGRGLLRLVEAASRVKNAYFVFIGGGSCLEELKSKVDSLNLRDRVLFIPTVPLSKLPSYTASADVGVQPIENTCLNHFTTDSNKLFEYVIAGLPVVASQLPEITKVVRAYDLGLLVTPGDTDSLSAAIQKLVDDPDLREHYRYRARSASKSLNWETQEQGLLDLYERVLSTSTTKEVP